MSEQQKSEPRIVTPEEAQEVHGGNITLAFGLACARTVATERERIRAAERAAFVRALRWAESKHSLGLWADAIENGADY